MPPSTTLARRQTIRHLLESSEVSSQAQLLDLLSEKGHQTTQPALSRDLRALNVAKRGGRYQLLLTDKVTPLSRLQVLLRYARPAGENLVVISCEPGAASAIARALEADSHDGLVGTVAGDDTVFCALEDREACDRLTAYVLSYL